MTAAEAAAGVEMMMMRVGVTSLLLILSIFCSAAWVRAQPQTNYGLLLIQQNTDGSDFFNRSWAEFKVGFGDPSGNYWIGNDRLSQLTANGGCKLKFDLQSRRNTDNWYFAKYSTFRVLTEADNYRLQVSGYSGNAGDALAYHNDMLFTTYDRDNDNYQPRNCAATRGGGFWYNRCLTVGVNVARSTGFFMWAGLRGGSDLQSSRMWLQRRYQ